MNEDFRDFLRALLEAHARFLVVGAHALAVHGVPRATGDLDVWIEASAENVERVWAGVLAFGIPVESLGVPATISRSATSWCRSGSPPPPRRIDLLTSMTGVTFDEAWPDRATHTVDDIAIPFLGRSSLVVNKRAVARLKDLADLEPLGEPTDPEPGCVR